MKELSNRKQHGFSLVTVLSVTLLATLWLTAALANLISVYRSTSASKFSSELSSYADSVNAYVLQVINDPDPNVRATLDNGGSPTSLPGTSWGAPAGSTASDTIASVTVVPLSPTLSSFLFDPTLSTIVPTNSNPTGFNYALATNSWRVITTTVKYAGLTKVTRLYGYRQLAASVPPPQSKTPASNIPLGSPAGTAPLFSSAILSTGTIQIGAVFNSSGADFSANPLKPIPVLSTDGHALGGDITTYLPVNLSGTQVTIGGSLTAMSVDNGASPITAQTQTPATTTVNRYVNTSGDVNNFYDGSPDFNQGSTNVLGLTNSNLSSQNPVIQVQQNAALTQSQNQVAPAPIAPGNATPADSIVASGQTLDAKDFSANALVVPSSSSLSVSGTSPTRVYLSDTGGMPGASTVAQINGVVNVGGLPANFQIFYGGTGTLDLTGATINGTIYAPRATVYMYNTSVNGAIVAGQVSGGLDARGLPRPTSNVNVVFDTSLANPNQLRTSKAQGLMLDPLAVQAGINGTAAVGANLGTFQIRYYAEQSKLH